MVKESGCGTSLDLAAVDKDSEAGKAGAGAKTNIFPFTTYFIPFATDLKYVSSACCIIQSSKQTKRINRRIIKISGGYKNDKGN